VAVSLRRRVPRLQLQTDYVPDDRILLAPSLTWRPTNDTNWTVLGIYQKDSSSSGPFLPHEGMLYPGPNGLIPVNRFAGDPGYDLYQTETAASAASSSTASAMR
jgi:iron complex outermembrane receptor protein